MEFVKIGLFHRALYCYNFNKWLKFYELNWLDMLIFDCNLIKPLKQKTWNLEKIKLTLSGPNLLIQTDSFNAITSQCN